MAYELSTVTAYIAALSINGKTPSGSTKAVTIRDLSMLRGTEDTRACPILYPDPTQLFVSNGSVERNSFGLGATAKQTINYSLRYRLLYAPVGMERDILSVFPNFIFTFAAILTALVANDAPTGNSVDFRLSSWTQGGTVQDASGAQFHGCDLTIDVQEFIN